MVAQLNAVGTRQGRWSDRWEPGSTHRMIPTIFRAKALAAIDAGTDADVVLARQIYAGG